MLIAALFTIAKIWKQPQCASVDYWIKNQWHIYIREYNYAIKKKKKTKTLHFRQYGWTWRLLC